MSEEAIVVFRTGQLGDTLLALPAIRAVRNAFPEARLVLVTDRHPEGRGFVSSWDVLGGTGLFDSVLFYEPSLRGLRALVPRLTLAATLRRLGARRLFYLSSFPRLGRQVARDRLFFRWLCGVKKAHGLEPAEPPFGTRDMSGALVRLPSEAGRLLGIVGGSVAAIPGPAQAQFLLPLAPSDERGAAALWRDAGWDDAAPVVAVAPGTKMPAKQWPEDRFATFGSRLLEARPGMRLLAVGAPAEAPLCDRLCRVWGPRSFSAAGRLSLMESAAALRRSALYVGNDTGAMHMASAVGTRCVGIFSARDHPGSWEPYGTGHRVLRVEVPCSGCRLEVCVEKKKLCLTEIPVEAVLDAALAALGA